MPPKKKNNVPRAKVALIDDHPVVRAGLAALISREPRFEICGEADDVTSGLKLVALTQPDVAIVDLALRNGSGLDLIRRIADRSPSVRILVASMYEESLFGERAIRAGAAGYITKQEAGRKIVDALHEILHGKMYLSEKLSTRLMRQAISERPARAGGPIAQLSDRELEVFTLIGRGETMAEIATRLHVSVKTAHTYRQRIKDKMAFQSAAELTREAMHWVIDNA